MAYIDESRKEINNQEWGSRKDNQTASCFSNDGNPNLNMQNAL